MYGKESNGGMNGGVVMNDIGTKTIETDRLILRRFAVEDAEDIYHNWTSDAEVSKYVSWSQHRSVDETIDVVSKWIEGYKTNSYNWVVELKETHDLIGSISAIRVSRVHNNCEIGYCYGSKFWNKGYATEALKAVICYLKKECNFHIVEARHRSTNPASGKVMEKAGMQKEAVLKERRYDEKTGEYSDLICYSI